MSSTVLLNLLRCGRSAVTRQTFLAVRSSSETSTAPGQASGSIRFDSDGSGRPVTWDSFGIWDNRIEEPILLPSSIRYGKPIPQVSLSRVGSASVLGLRKQNEDRLRFARINDNLLYFAVFDGHGGPHAADYCYTFMEKFIRSTFITCVCQIISSLNVCDATLKLLLNIFLQRRFGGGRGRPGESFKESLFRR
uniref:PPM-type phosphatase domain-containing protein n=1 Tax=Seriola dumerili TaxID=41447 RepID=A0A3B4UC27_SERDU